MHLSNTEVQFSIEKYFWAVFDKLKIIDLGFSGVSGVLAVSPTPGVHLLLQNLVIWHHSLWVSSPTLPMVHCCNILSRFLINKKSTIGFSRVSVVSADEGFNLTFIVTSIVLPAPASNINYFKYDLPHASLLLPIGFPRKRSRKKPPKHPKIRDRFLLIYQKRLENIFL